MNKNEKKIDKLDKSVSRRTFLKTAAAGAAVAAVGFPAIVRSAQDLKIVMRDPGGPFAPGFAEAFYKPFFEIRLVNPLGKQYECPNCKQQHCDNCKL